MQAILAPSAPLTSPWPCLSPIHRQNDPGGARSLGPVIIAAFFVSVCFFFVAASRTSND